eukprot:GHVR01010392.1.p1 GENE.GHVR01010392.1~~GHVR01010392.1.p1  ORF type:complete len:120 (+),score=10.66 GHVR01010392.1:98-457(+)
MRVNLAITSTILLAHSLETSQYSIPFIPAPPKPPAATLNAPGASWQRDVVLESRILQDEKSNVEKDVENLKVKNFPVIPNVFHDIKQETNNALEKRVLRGERAEATNSSEESDVPFYGK